MARTPKTLNALSLLKSIGQWQGGPRDVRVFSQGRLLLASYDHGREQVLDARAHGRRNLVTYFKELTGTGD